jgi:hypothetical protein
VDAEGRVRFIETPPTMTVLDPDVAASVGDALAAYLETTRADIRLLLSHYEMADTVRRVVGVGSVGTRCYLSALVDGDGSMLLMQTKEAGRSVLIDHGRCAQPPDLDGLIGPGGRARVVAMQRILQGVSDPFLGFFRERDYYVRQFRDMKGGIDAEVLDDESFALYARACAPFSHERTGSRRRRGGGRLRRGRRIVADAIVAWSQAYADLSRQDFAAFAAEA